MNKRIYEILQNAGVSKGLSEEEALLILALSGSETLRVFEQILDEKVSSGSFPKEEKDAIMLELEKIQITATEAQKTFLHRVNTSYEKAFLNLLNEEIDRQKQELSAIEKEVAHLFS